MGSANQEFPLRAALVKSVWIPIATVGLAWLVTMAAFWPARHYGFLFFDDDINIFLNPHIGGMNRVTTGWMLTDIHYMRRYIPAGWAGLSILYGLFGLDPHGYHWANIFLHGVNVLLVTAICHEGIKRFGPRPAGGSWAVVSAALAGAWWGWHPLRVETVAWASGYLHVQAIFFMLGSFYLYISCRKGPGDGWLNPVMASLLYVLSLATYPLALAYPAVLLFWEGARLQRQARVLSAEWWDGLEPLVPRVLGWFGLPAAAFGAMTLYASFQADPLLWGQPPSLEKQDIIERLGRAVYFFGYYLWKPWWPFRSKLVPNSICTRAWQEPGFWLCLLALAGVIGVGLAVKSSWRPGFWAMAAAYLVLLVPMSGLTQSTLFASDRYSYLASLPLVMALALALNACAKPLARWIAGGAFVLLLGGLFVLTRQQLGAWNDSETFLKVALSGFSRPEDEKGRIYLILTNSLNLQGRYAQARVICAQGLKEFPDLEDLRRQKLQIEQTMELSAQEQRVLGLAAPVPELARFHMRIALKQWADGETREAADHFREALRVAPDYYPARLMLAEVLTVQGKPDEALSCYLRALAASNGHMPDAVRVHFLFMLAHAGALNGEERLARMALDKGVALCAKLSRPVP